MQNSRITDAIRGYNSIPTTFRTNDGGFSLKHNLDIQCKKTSPGQANTQAILHSRERTQGSPLKSAAAEQTVARSKSNKRERRFASPLAICDASSLRDPTKTRHSAGTTPTGSEHVPRHSFARRSGNLGGSQSQSLLISN